MKKINIKAIPFVLIMFMACGTSDIECIDPAKINEEAVCTMDYTPVCGCDSKTYSNACAAENSGVTTWTEGECPE